MTTTAETTQLFHSGILCASPETVRLINSGYQESATLKSCLLRHLCGDWGDLDEQQRHYNDHCLTTGDRLISTYKIGGGKKLIISTEPAIAATLLYLDGEGPNFRPTVITM